MERINRIKVVLAEKQRTNKWLAEKLGKDTSTVSKWCTNSSQPDIQTFLQIAEALEVDIRELLVGSQDSVVLVARPKSKTI
ncbi:Helix-turn-helix [Xylanibacter ruminicola]|jgi:transcriptional regulator with XRE-family HTH domain|uniref:Helix-turn-helix n=1 Tax=Xylanibacter ruminicola TaxID=839 RepID=A0A1H5XQC1_XYLRU|nr:MULTISPECIES: helix-turn-helix transcriptional regulator [Prevotellaceae]MBQ2507791.1 helix-turn-helix transcriptional regulator [Bacteroidaceae bacterium]MCF2638230.1 helix-turn-helix transcriptional regulator [Prevotella dentalis]SEG13951.1 Helix-turn-helix [Xylanibacter ruminicola]